MVRHGWYVCVGFSLVTRLKIVMSGQTDKKLKYICLSILYIRHIPKNVVNTDTLSRYNTCIVIKQEILTIYNQVTCLHKFYGGKYIGKRSITCKPNKGQTPIIIISTIFGRIFTERTRKCE